MSEIQVATISERYYDEPLQSFDTEQPDFYPLPVYNEQCVITSQPDRTDFGKPHQRRPIPIDTTDWTSTPRSVLNPICSTQFLYGVRQLEIQQTVDLRTLMGDCRSGNHYKYRVKVPRAETLFLATELAETRIIGSSRGFTVDLQDASGQTAFSLKKGRTWGCMPGYLHKLSVVGNDLVGTVEQDFTIFAPRFTVYDAEREALCRIYVPHTFCSCMYKEARFQVSSTDGCRPLASITLNWDRQAMDYTLMLTFPLDMDVKLKSLLLGAAFLMRAGKCGCRTSTAGLDYRGAQTREEASGVPTCCRCHWLPTRKILRFLALVAPRAGKSATLSLQTRRLGSRVMEEERMPKVNLSRDLPRLTVSDIHHMKRIEQENIERVAKLKRTRLLNRITGAFLGLGVIGIYSYTIYAVKQEKFLDDFDEPEKISDAE